MKIYYSVKNSSKAVFALILLVIPLYACGELNVKNFDFRGKRFGEKLVVEKGIPPWEMDWSELRDYGPKIDPAIKDRFEKDASKIFIGDQKISEIKYIYFKPGSGTWWSRFC